MLAGGRVGPFAGWTFRRVLEPDIHRAAGCVARIAHEPVVALAATAGKIMPAHRLGLPAETVREIGSVLTCHHAASRSEMRATGYVSSTLARTPGPAASAGTKKRSFHEMISLNRP